MIRRTKILFGSIAAVAATLFATVVIGAVLTGQVTTGIIANYRGSADLGSATFNLSQGQQPPILFANGTGSGQANALFADQRTLGASATENLDLSGALLDPFGTTLLFTTVKALKVCAAATNVNNVVVGGAGSNTFIGVFSDPTDKVAIRPGGCFVWVAPQTGATVTPGTGDILLVANSGGTTGVTYDVIVLGVQ